MSEIVRIPKSSNSNSERGIRWFTLWNIKTRVRQTAILCRCNRLVIVRPKTGGEVDFKHKCGFGASIVLQDYTL